MVSFLEKWIEADCGENHRPLSQVGESHWILLTNIFSAHGVPIAAESAVRSPHFHKHGAGFIARLFRQNLPASMIREILFRFLH